MICNVILCQHSITTCTRTINSDLTSRYVVKNRNHQLGVGKKVFQKPADMILMIRKVSPHHNYKEHKVINPDLMSGHLVKTQNQQLGLKKRGFQTPGEVILTICNVSPHGTWQFGFSAAHNLRAAHHLHTPQGERSLGGVFFCSCQGNFNQK